MHLPQYDVHVTYRSLIKRNIKGALIVKMGHICLKITSKFQRIPSAERQNPSNVHSFFKFKDISFLALLLHLSYFYLSSLLVFCSQHPEASPEACPGRLRG